MKNEFPVLLFLLIGFISYREPILNISPFGSNTDNLKKKKSLNSTSIKISFSWELWASRIMVWTK